MGETHFLFTSLIFFTGRSVFFFEPEDRVVVLKESSAFTIASTRASPIRILKRPAHL